MLGMRALPLTLLCAAAVFTMLACKRPTPEEAESWPVLGKVSHFRAERTSSDDASYSTDVTTDTGYSFLLSTDEVPSFHGAVVSREGNYVSIQGRIYYLWNFNYESPTH